MQQYNMVDVNSAQYRQDVQRLKSLRLQVVLWLVVIALGVVLIPLMLVTGWVRNDVTRLESELSLTQNALTSAQLPSQEVTMLSAEAARLNQLVSTMQTMTLPSGVNWPLVVYAVGSYDVNSLKITSLTQTGDKLQIAGRAVSNDAVVRYQQSLIDARAFRDVLVVSMSTLPPTPVATAETQEAEVSTLTVTPSFDVEFLIDLLVGNATP
jgi:Tfp pilus assembly protein PilN